MTRGTCTTYIELKVEGHVDGKIDGQGFGWQAANELVKASNFDPLSSTRWFMLVSTSSRGTGSLERLVKKAAALFGKKLPEEAYLRGQRNGVDVLFLSVDILVPPPFTRQSWGQVWDMESLYPDPYEKLFHKTPAGKELQRRFDTAARHSNERLFRSRQ